MPLSQKHQHLILLYIAIMVGIYMIKPTIMFDPYTGAMLAPGLGPGKSVIAYSTIALILPIFMYIWAK